MTYLDPIQAPLLAAPPVSSSTISTLPSNISNEEVIGAIRESSIAELTTQSFEQQELLEKKVWVCKVIAHSSLITGVALLPLASTPFTIPIFIVACILIPTIAGTVSETAIDNFNDMNSKIHDSIVKKRQSERNKRNLEMTATTQTI